MSGTLFVVATPIGNLEDITLRALRVLREADVIAAEDTRRTAKLLAHYAISTPPLSFHHHNTRSRMPQILARLQAGERVALVTDAGTPGISDPGTELVRACAEQAIAVEPVPGASAPVAAAIASGFPLDPLTILGFAPALAKDRNLWMLRVQAIKDTFTFFETPHRIRQTLLEAPLIFGDRPMFVGREITKLHQQFLSGSASALIGQLTEFKGEVTVVGCSAAGVEIPGAESTDAEIFHEFGQMADTKPGGRRAAVAALAKRHRRSPRQVYDIIERLKKSVV